MPMNDVLKYRLGKGWIKSNPIQTYTYPFACSSVSRWNGALKKVLRLVQHLVLHPIGESSPGFRDDRDSAGGEFILKHPCYYNLRAQCGQWKHAPDFKGDGTCMATSTTRKLVLTLLYEENIGKMLRFLGPSQAKDALAPSITSDLVNVSRTLRICSKFWGNQLLSCNSSKSIMV
eukprot:scaffold764_cov363-Pavlova_lutheri.AAC.22